MAKKFTAVSHVERLLNKDLHCKVKKDMTPNKQRTLVEEKQVVDGRVMRVLVEKLTDPRDNFNKYKSTDFCIENLMETGSIGTLKNCNLSHSQTEVVESAVGVLNKLDNIE